MFTFKVVPEDGDPFIVKAGTRDVLSWEKTTKGNKSYAQLMAEPNLVDYYKICHIAAWRQQLFTGTLQEFEKTHEIDLAIGEDEIEEPADEEPDPTPPGHSTGDSSNSPSSQGSPRPRGRRKANEQ